MNHATAKMLQTLEVVRGQVILFYGFGSDEMRAFDEAKRAWEQLHGVPKVEVRKRDRDKS